MKKIVILLSLFIFLTLNGAAVFASDVIMSGDIAYKISDEKVEFWVGKISNMESGGHSGTLKLKLFATSARYQGGSITGYIVGQYVLGTLDGGSSFENLDVTTAYTAPPYASYYITLLLTEWNGSNDVVVDYIEFEKATIGYEAPVSEDDSGGSGCFIQSILP